MDIIPQLIMNSLIAGSIYTMIALGFNLIYGTIRFFDLGYGALTAVGGYSVYYFSNLLGLNVFLSIIFGVLISGLIGFLINKFVYKKLRQRNASSIVYMVATLGVFTALQAIIAILFSSQFQTLSRNSGGDRTFQILGGIVTQTQTIIFILGALATIFLVLTLKYTKFGRAVRAISDDIDVSKIVGINTEKVIGGVFFIGSAIAGLAGILVGFDTGIEPTMGFSLILKGVIAAIVGGVGNIYGGVLGAFLLGFVENFGIWQISGEWKDAIAFVILIVFLLFRPVGILGRK